MAAMVTIAVLGTALGSGVLAAMPTTVLTENWGQSRAVIGALLPESWEFFTRDPTTAALVMYDVEAAKNGQFLKRGTLPQTTRENAFGLSRNQRAQDTEEAVLANVSNSWVDCGGMRASECLMYAATQAPDEIEGVEHAPFFCGDFLLAEQSPVPFPYRDSTSETVQVLRATRITTTC